MYKLTPLDFDNDSDFLYELMESCSHELESVAIKNIDLTIIQMEDAVRTGTQQVFKAMVDDEPIGALSIALLPNELVELHGLLAQDERVKGRRALSFIRMAIDYCFNELDAFKVKATINAGNKPLERLLRHLGFTKQGVLMGEWVGAQGRENAIALQLIHPAKKAIIKKNKQKE